MARRIILISGPVSSGKSTLADGLVARHGVQVIKTKDLIQQSQPRTAGQRRRLQIGGDRLDRETGGVWVSEAVTRAAARLDEGVIILVDAVRTADQIKGCREAFGTRVVHIHVTAPAKVLEARYTNRQDPKDELKSYADVKRNRTERAIGALAEIADVVIDSNACTVADVLVRAAAHLGFYAGGHEATVDVLVGGGFGSEGKGHIASYLAPEYQVLVRVGGPNAGHQVYERPDPYIHHQLPSGTRRSEAYLVIGPGAVLDVDSLSREINECGVSMQRLAIDPKAMIIDRKDVALEKATLEKWIASTAQGVGAATARRIMRGAMTPGLRKATSLAPVRLAGDVPEIRPWVRDTHEVLNDAFARGDNVLVEGTQGAGLSIYHGDYPHVTSRDTTVSGALSEAGIAPSRLRHVVMVCRTHPIRVQDPDTAGMTSGPMSNELSWQDIAARSGQDVKELMARELTSTTHRQRRVGEFDWALLRRAASLNAPTDIAVTHVDYFSEANAKARRFEQLTRETINFIDEVERVAGTIVSMISTRFHYRSIIDRRSW